MLTLTKDWTPRPDQLQAVYHAYKESEQKYSWKQQDVTRTSAALTHLADVFRHTNPGRSLMNIELNEYPSKQISNPTVCLCVQCTF